MTLALICKYAAILRKVLNNPLKKEARNILAIRTDRFGEFILTLPAIYALKENFPQSRLTLMANSYSAQLIRNNPLIDEIIEYEENRFRGIGPTFKLISQFQERKFDLAVVFNPKKKFHLITFLAGIPIRVGYNRKWGFLLNHKIKDLKYLGAKHEIEYNFDLLKAIDIDSDKKSPQININRQEEERVLVVLAKYGINKETKFIVVHPWTSDTIKQWPVNYFIDLVKRIASELNTKVLIIGGREEAPKAKEYFINLGNNVINLTGQVSLKESAVILKYAKLLISGDSGPVHLASSVGTPVVAIFRNDIPGKSATRWGPTSKGSIVIENSNLGDISPQEVLEKVRSAIK